MNLSEFNSEMQVTRRDFEATRCDLEATRQEFETQLASVEARTRLRGGNAEASGES
jgi:hypothetical protein